MTEKIKFKAANPPKIMKYNHYAQGALGQDDSNLIVTRKQTAYFKHANVPLTASIPTNH